MPRKRKLRFPQMETTTEMDSWYLSSLKKSFHIPQIHSTKFLIGEDSKEFKCNASILAVISPVFRRSLLQSKHKTRKPVKLPNITPPGFSALVRFGFSFDPEIGPDNVIEVIHAAKECQVYIIYDLALMYLSAILQNHFDVYFIRYLELAAKFSLREVSKLCLGSLCVAGGASQFLKSERFGEFSAEFVNCLLSLDELPVEEICVWESVKAWAQVQSRKLNIMPLDALKKVYRNVRFPLMCTKDFTCHVVPVGVLTRRETLDLFCHLCYPEGNPETGPFSAAPRHLWDDVCINRYSNCGDNWFHLDGYIDCIGIESSRTCQMLAVGVFVGKGETRCRIKIFLGQGDNRKLLEDTGDITIMAEEKSPKPARVNLKGHVVLQPGEVYEIEVNQNGPTSYKLKNGTRTTVHKCNDLEIQFTWNKLEYSETNVKKGNIPCIWVRVHSGNRK